MSSNNSEVTLEKNATTDKTTKDDNNDVKEQPLKRSANEFSEDSNSVLESSEAESGAQKKQKTRENGTEDESNDANDAEAGNELEDEEEDEEEDVVPEDYADDDDDEEAANDDEDDDDDDQ